MRAREAPVEMSGARAGALGPPSSPSRPSEHVLNSGAVVFPGVFDQHGCPLVLFPAEAHQKLSQELSREEVLHFIHYCLRLHNIRGEAALLSVAVDLRQADLAISRFIAETLLLLEFDRRILHSVYIVQPKKKDVQKQLRKLLTASGSKPRRPVLFRRIFLKEVFELANYIDRSQLTSSLGGYLIYCHQSWAAFVKEIDVFVQEFLLVVSRLPSCISTLQSLSKLPVPADFERLQEFCSVNEGRFQQLRRDLGLDDLLKQCECLMEKLRFPENDPCFQAMAGTVLYTHTALEMLRNYNRITAAVEKVELLWQQVFSRAHVQLQLLRLQREAGQIQEQMVVLHRQKLQSYRTEEAKDTHTADQIRLQFETSVYTHAMALVRRAEDVIHTLAETVPVAERKSAEPWLDDLSRLKEILCSAVQHPYQTLRSVSDFHHACDRCKSWYERVLGESLLQELLWREHCESGSSSGGVQTFLRRHPCPEVQELVKLARLSNIITDPNLQQTGTRLSHRCMTLRRLLTSAGAVPLHDLHLALQWQYEYLKGHHRSSDITSPEDQRHTCGLPPDSALVQPALAVSQCESLCDLTSPHGAAAKPPSLSSFDSGFDGAGNSHLDSRSRREVLPRFLGNTDSTFKVKPLHEENIVSVSDSEDQPEELGFGLQRASIQIVPKITCDSMNLEITVTRSATLPKNPWLSLPIDDLESSYTVTITPNARSPSPSERLDRDQPTQTDGTRQHQSFESSELNPAGNVLSSTLTDNEEKPSSTGDGDPSLLWDSFDLHNLRRDSFERLDVSLCDWVQREQQELEEVEETLERTAEILQEEENVLAQEVVLDELLRSEDLHKHWPVWTEGHQHSMMSPGDLAESGVIGLDDVLQTELASLDSGTLKASESDSDAPGLANESPSMSERPGQLDTRCPEVDRSGILRELRDLQVLEEQIIEEHLKLDALRCTETETLQSEQQTHVTTRSFCGERRMFLAQLEKEKREVEKMERSLSREMEKAGKARKRSSKGCRVVKCLVMERNSKLKDLDGELLRNCRPESARHDPQLTDVEKPACFIINTEESTSPAPPDPAEDASVSDSSLTPEPLSSTSQSAPITSLSEIGIGGPTAPDSVPCSESLQDDQSSKGEPFVLSSLPGTCTPDQELEAMDSTEGPNAHSEHPEGEVSSCGCTDGGDSAADQAELDTSEAPSTQNSSAVRDAFDPGGVSIAPVPAPRRAFPLDDQLGRSERRPSGSEQVESAAISAFDACTRSTSSGLHMQNNNNNTAVMHRAEIQDISGSSTAAPETQALPYHDEDSLTRPCAGREGVSHDEDSLTRPCAGREGVSHDEDSLTGPCAGREGVSHDEDSLTGPCAGREGVSHDEDSLTGPCAGREGVSHDEDSLTGPCAGREGVSHDEDSLTGPCAGREGVSHDEDSLTGPCPGRECVSHDEDSLTGPCAGREGVSHDEDSLTGPCAGREGVSHDEDSLTRQCPGREGVSHDEDSLTRPCADREGFSHDAGGSMRAVCRSPLHQLQLNSSTRQMSDYKTPIVLDTGSGLMKAGFADQDLPTTVFPTVIGHPKYEEVMNGSVDRELYIGHDAQHMRGVLTLRYPIRNGIVRNWDEMEMIWHHAFQRLSVSPEDHPVLLTEAAMNPVQNRQRMVELMFECFSVPLVFVALQAVLALYASGRTTGVVLDSGDGVSHSVPVFEGYCLPHAVQRFNLAGADVTLQLQKLLLEQGVCMRTSAELEIVREMKERCCCVALDYEAELKSAGTEVHHTLPDGRVVSLSSERFRAPEILFRPELIGRDHYGMHESVFRSILQSDIDLRRSFVGNVLLSGGNTLLPGLPERLRQDIARMCPADLSAGVRVISPPERDFSVWSGGAALASRADLGGAWICAEEYEEFGPQIVLRKCF